MLATGPATVLVVDEKPETLCLLTKALETHGYGTVAASGLPQALALGESIPSLKLIVLDLTMSGVDLIRRACRSRPELQVLFLTDGLANIPFRQSDSVLLKPFNIDTFTNVVRRTLEEPRTATVDLGLGPERRRMAAQLAITLTCPPIRHTLKSSIVSTVSGRAGLALQLWKE